MCVSPTSLTFLHIQRYTLHDHDFPDVVCCTPKNFTRQCIYSGAYTVRPWFSRYCKLYIQEFHWVMHLFWGVHCMTMINVVHLRMGQKCILTLCFSSQLRPRATVWEEDRLHHKVVSQPHFETVTTMENKILGLFPWILHDVVCTHASESRLGNLSWVTLIIKASLKYAIDISVCSILIRSDEDYEKSL